jgi:hypothetical protein
MKETAMRTVEKLKGAERRAHRALRKMDLYALTNAGVTSDYTNRLVRASMRYDAAFHPKPEWFDDWARGGYCPYMRGRVGGVYPERQLFFYVNRFLYKPGRAMSAIKLLTLARKVKKTLRARKLIALQEDADVIGI